MTENDKKYGRTFFDFIAEHPKWTFFTFLFVVFVLACLVIFGIHFKFGNLEVDNKKNVLHDTIIKKKTDTQYIDKSPIIIKSTPTIRQPKITEKSVSVKSNDTIITVQNHPANINTGTNNGIIGNNNNVKVEEKQRTLSEIDKAKILFEINTLKSANKSKTNCLKFAITANNKEAYLYGSEMAVFLQSKGFEISEISQAFFAPPVFGAEMRLNEEKNCIDIFIGLIN